MANTQFKVDNGLLVSGDSLFQANATVNASANVVQNLRVGGDLSVVGDIGFTNMIVSGQLLPTSNGILLGNTTRRFTASADNLNFSNSIVTANNIAINIRAGDGIVANTTAISVNAASISNGVLNIGQGGTNAATRSVAINNLLPTQNVAVSGHFLITDGTNATWAAGTGFTGSRGATGFTGSQGATGPQGVGFTGSQGAAGATGAAGINGAPGATGATGAQGPIGFTGSRGAAGFTGSAGTNGTSGTTGFTGSQGILGFTGSQGATGATGTFTGSYTGNMAITGAITATGDITAFFSDDRLKTKFGNIESALDKLLALSGFIFEPNELAQSLGYEKKREVGVSAQEVNAVLPEAIASAPIDSKYMAVKYEKLIPLVIEAIKELADIVKALENKSNAS
jgi:hypothetical protein